MLERVGHWGGVDWAGAGQSAVSTVGEHASRVMLGLALIYSVFTAVYLASLPELAVLAALTGVSAVLFFTLWAFTRRRELSTFIVHCLIGIIVVVVIANTNVEYGIAGDPMHATILLCGQIVAGIAVPTVAWLLFFLVVNAATAFTINALADVGLPWRDAILGFLTVTGAALIIFFIRMRLLTTMRELRRREHEGRDRDMREIIAKNPDAVVLLRDGVVVYANEALVDYLDLDSVDDLVGEPLESVVTAGADGLRDLLAGAEVEGAVLLELAKANGERIVVDVAEPKHIEFGSAPAIMLVGRDVTASQQELQARLLLADRMSVAGTLASGVAHEINNPLTYVLMNLEALAQEVEHLPGERQDDVRQTIDEIAEGIDRVAVIVRDLNALSRIGGVDERITDPNGALRTAIKMAENQIRHRAELVVNLNRTGGVLINDGKLVQVFLNLLINAAHALDDGDPASDRVEISTRDGVGEVIVEVRDTGCGMSEETQARAFDPFFTTKATGRGTGLGLFFCHSVVTDAGGRIEFESKVGEGTVVRIALPATEPSSAEIRRFPLGSRPPPQDRLRILIVDDEPRVGRAIARSLKNHKVTVATNGKDAIELCKGGRFDLVICDLMMPGLSGRDVYHQLAEHDASIDDRFVFMTGGAFTPRAKEFAASSHIQVLSKPVPVATLLELIADHTP